MNANIFYLHGFASSPSSTKAAFFERHLAARGLRLHCPDLNAPDFETLTVTGMIARVEEAVLALPAAPTVLIGSSLGALVAVELASRWSKQCAVGCEGAIAAHPIDRLVLLAPALDFVRNRQRHLGDQGLEQWKRSGSLEVFHHAEGRARRVHYGLYEDALKHDPFAAYLDFPVLIFHGRRDETVDAASVEAFARGRSNVRLRLLDDDHQLHASLDRIWRETAEFLGLRERP
ncbi:MAG: YqiA/YcfP family alpha/beta fold hydrolase [Bacteroidales bacterium]